MTGSLFSVRLLPPNIPNFARLDAPRQHGQDAPVVRIADLTPEQRDVLARMFRDGLDAVAARQAALGEGGA